MNDEILASLRFRRIRTMVLFYAFIVLMPLGCICPCSLAFAIPHDTTRTVLGVIAFLLPFVGLGGTLLMMGDMSRYAKMYAVARTADELGFAYTDYPKEKKYAFLRSLRLFRDQNFDAADNYFAGKYKGFDVAGLNYGIALGFGRYQTVFTQTVIILYDAVPDVPDFVLSPRGLLQKFIPWLSGHRIEVPGEDKFNKEFALGGGLREDEVADHFTEDVIDLFLAERDLSAELADGTLVVCRRNTIASAQGIEPLLKLAVKVARALRQGESR